MLLDFFLKLERDLEKFLDVRTLRFHNYLQIINPRFLPVLFVRLAYFFWTKKLGICAKVFSLVNQVCFGCDIARGARIDGGLYLPHPNGIVIGEYVKIGLNCIIHQGVTLGARGEDHELSNPVVKDEVEIGTGAKILGKLTIGNYARIGANAVVLESVPDKGIAVGIPAKIVGYREDI
jgi:serine O-acetyltransferase